MRRCLNVVNIFNLFIFLAEGRLDVTKDGQKVLTFEPEDMFGELALLYDSTHTYSVSGRLCVDVFLDVFLQRSTIITRGMPQGKLMGGTFLIHFDLDGK